jgi:hypothetical protein
MPAANAVLRFRGMGRGKSITPMGYDYPGGVMPNGTRDFATGIPLT